MVAKQVQKETEEQPVVQEKFSLKFDMNVLLCWVVVLVVLQVVMKQMKMKTDAKSLGVALVVVWVVLKMCPWMKMRLHSFVSVHQKVLVTVLLAWVVLCVAKKQNMLPKSLKKLKL